MASHNHWRQGLSEIIKGLHLYLPYIMGSHVIHVVSHDTKRYKGSAVFIITQWDVLSHSQRVIHLTHIGSRFLPTMCLTKINDSRLWPLGITDGGSHYAKSLMDRLPRSTRGIIQDPWDRSLIRCPTGPHSLYLHEKNHKTSLMPQVYKEWGWWAKWDPILMGPSTLKSSKALF